MLMIDSHIILEFLVEKKKKFLGTVQTKGFGSWLIGIAELLLMLFTDDLASTLAVLGRVTGSGLIGC